MLHSFRNFFRDQKHPSIHTLRRMEDTKNTKHKTECTVILINYKFDILKYLIKNISLFQDHFFTCIIQ